MLGGVAAASRRRSGGGGGGYAGPGTVTTFFPLDTANGYANLGSLSAAGNASAGGSGGVINSTYTKNRPQAFNAPSTAAYLIIPAGSFPNCGSSDWCLEFWAAINMDPVANGRWAALSGDHGSSSNPGLILLDYDETTNGGVRYTLRDTAGVQEQAITSHLGTSFTMYHWCIIRSGNTLYYMFDGVQLATDDVTGQSFDFSANTTFALRRHYDNAEGTTGSISEIRFITGDTVYNPAGFTPPTSPLSA